MSEIVALASASRVRLRAAKSHSQSPSLAANIRRPLAVKAGTCTVTLADLLVRTGFAFGSKPLAVSVNLVRTPGPHEISNDESPVAH